MSSPNSINKFDFNCVECRVGEHNNGYIYIYLDNKYTFYFNYVIKYRHFKNLIQHSPLTSVNIPNGITSIATIKSVMANDIRK